MIDTVITVLVLVAAGAAVIMPLVFGLGSVWWKYLVGKSLMLDSTTYALILCYVAYRRLALPHLQVSESIDITAVVIYGVIASVKVWMAYAFTKVVKAGRRTRRGSNTGDFSQQIDNDPTEKVADPGDDPGRE